MSVSLYYGPCDFSKCITVSYQKAEASRIVQLKENIGEMILQKVKELAQTKHLTCLGSECLKRGVGHTVKVGFALIDGKCMAKVIAGVVCGNKECELCVKNMLKQKLLNDFSSNKII